MKVNKTFTTISAAVALVSAIGLAYAQTSGDSAQPATTTSDMLPQQNQQQQAQVTDSQQQQRPADAVRSTTPETSSTMPAQSQPSTSIDGTQPASTDTQQDPLTERAPRADRN